MSRRVRCPPWPGTTHSRSYGIGPHVPRRLKLLLVRLPGLVLIQLINRCHNIFVYTSALLGGSLCLCRMFCTKYPTRKFDSFLELMSASISTQHHLRNTDPGDKSRFWTPRRCTRGLSTLHGGMIVVGAGLPVLRGIVTCRDSETILLAKSLR